MRIHLFVLVFCSKSADFWKNLHHRQSCWRYGGCHEVECLDCKEDIAVCSRQTGTFFGKMCKNLAKKVGHKGKSRNFVGDEHILLTT